LEIIVNVAQSLNGFISGPGGKTARISSPSDQIRVHMLRASVDGILVGANTVICDNPDLTARPEDGTVVRPARIILDGGLRIPRDSRVLDSRSRTLVFTSVRDREIDGAELLVSPRVELTVPHIIDVLQELGMKKILIEGGANVISQFVESLAVTRFYLFIGQVIMPEGGVRLFSPNKEIEGAIMSSRIEPGGILLELDPEKLVNAK
jgi:riboflavin-specific deaminase-like protein